jgi:hypothetical protein
MQSSGESTHKRSTTFVDSLLQLERQGHWYLRLPAAYATNSANRENASACLDLTIEVIRRKHDHIRAARTASEDKPYETPPAYVGQPLFERPTRDSAVIRVLAEDDRYVVKALLTGFDGGTIFYRIECTPSSGGLVWGYVERIEEQPLDEPSAEAQSSTAPITGAPSPDAKPYTFEHVCFPPQRGRAAKNRSGRR